MAEPILLDRFRDNSYSQTQLINDKLDFLIGEFREVKQDIRDINARIDKLDTKIDDVDKRLDAKIDGVEEKLNAKMDGVEKKLDAKMDKLQAEVQEEFRTARWQVIGLVSAQLVGVGAIVWAIVSALK